MAARGLTSPTTARQGTRVHSVWEICQHIQHQMARDDLLPDVWVRGEVSNLKHGMSGHAYFTLKDEHAQLACVLWRDDAERLPFDLQDGLSLLVHGRVNIYGVRGQIQLNAWELQPDGHGRLALAFEQLKERLGKEGLFEEQRKTPLPPFPERVGIVTSLQGAALRDMLRILAARFPLIEVTVRGVRVQGSGAAEEIAHAVRLFNRHGKVDVLVIGRGGGSIEDLWSFNEEIVARAIAASEIPVISAVGHETDFTIADFVSDRRAATPSNAAEVAVPDAADLLDGLDTHERRLRHAAYRCVAQAANRLAGLEQRAALRQPRRLLDAWAQRLDEAAVRLERRTQQALRSADDEFQRAASLLDSYSPLRTLQRGYAIVTVQGKPATTVASLQGGTRAVVRVTDGLVPVVVAHE